MIKIEDYILLPKEERQKHLKLDQPCIERGGGTGLVSQYMKGALAHILDTSIPQTRKIYINHACHNGLCSNPFHVYWGTPRENWEDGVACGKIKSVRHNSILKSHPEPFRIARDYKQFTSVAMISPTKLIDHLHDGSDIIFEGAQGVLLDEKYGEPQHNTWTDCTYNNAVKILSEMPIRVSEVVRVGVLRSYFTRHGEGKFDEDPSMNYPEPHNSHPSFQGRFRIGKFDSKKVKYALECLGGVDMVALNHLDIHPEQAYKDQVLWAYS